MNDEDKLKIALKLPASGNYAQNPFHPEDNYFHQYKYYLMTLTLTSGYDGVIFDNKEVENAAIIPLMITGDLVGELVELNEGTVDSADPMITTASVALLALSLLAAE